MKDRAFNAVLQLVVASDGRAVRPVNATVCRELGMPGPRRPPTLDDEVLHLQSAGVFGHANCHHAALRAFELIMIRWKIGEWKESGYALRELEGRVYYMKYGTKKNAEFTNRR